MVVADQYDAVIIGAGVFAPVAGKIMAALVKACEAGHDHDADPLTFHLSHIDKPLSLGAFSRRREINPNSSFSVIG